MTKISIIIPIYNGAKWIDRCFTSILSQTIIKNNIQIEVCVCNDASSDNTDVYLQKWDKLLRDNKIPLIIYNNTSGFSLGVGFAKNRAVQISTGTYLCFQDVDDIMLPRRIEEQYNYAMQLDDSYIIGSKFERDPPGSTHRFTIWCNNLNKTQLNEQIYTSNGPTIIMPTWFMHKNVFSRIDGFSEQGYGVPEDLIFFYKHLDKGGHIDRVDEILLIYQYHSDATTFSVLEETIWNLRIKQLEKHILNQWTHFTIWNAGKQGRKFYKSLSEYNKNKVVGMCDVDIKKIGKYYELFNPLTRKIDRRIPIVHFSQAIKPFIICVKMNITNGQFEENLKSLNLKETVDYILFS